MFERRNQDDLDLDRVLELYHLGLQVIPDGGEKHPRYRWKRWQTERIPEDQLTGWINENPDASWDVITGELSGVVVIEADDAEAVSWVQKHLPHTPIRTISRKGVHHYYKHPGQGVRVQNTTRLLGLSIDRRGDGGVAVLPGSLHPSGFRYRQAETWTAEAWAAMPTYDPSWFPEEERRPRTGTSVFDGPYMADLPAHAEAIAAPHLAPVSDRVTIARADFAGKKGATASKGADKYCFALACSLLWDYALPADDARDILYTWGQRSDQMDEHGGSYPWTDAEIDHKIDDALARGEPKGGPVGWRTLSWIDFADDRVHEKIKGVDTPSPAPEPVRLETTKKPKYKIRTMDDLFTMTPPDWLIDKHLTRGGLLTLFAPSGNYKSFVAIDMSVSVATGTPFLGKFPTRKGKVAYVVSEGLAGLPKRVRALNAARGHKGRNPDWVYLAGSFDLLDRDVRDELMAQLVEHFGQKPDLIVVDTVSKNFGGENTSDPQQMQKFCDNVLGWETAVIAVHHAGWNAERERGASNIRDCSDATFRVLKDTNLAAAVTCLKQKDNEPADEYKIVGKLYGDGDEASVAFSHGGVGQSPVVEVACRFPSDPAKGRTISDVLSGDVAWLHAKGWADKTVRNHVTAAQERGWLAVVPGDEDKPKNVARRYYRTES